MLMMTLFLSSHVNMLTTIQPKKAVALGSGVKCLPDVASYPKAKKPIVIYEHEGNADSKKVREAVSMLDLIVEYRPCPGEEATWIFC